MVSTRPPVNSSSMIASSVSCGARGYEANCLGRAGDHKGRPYMIEGESGGGAFGAAPSAASRHLPQRGRS